MALEDMGEICSQIKDSIDSIEVEVQNQSLSSTVQPDDTQRILELLLESLDNINNASKILES